MCLDEAEADYCEDMFLTTFVDWVISKFETLGAAALPSVADSFQLVLSGIDQDLYEASSIRGELSTKSNGRMFRAVAAALAGPDEKGRHNDLRGVLKSLVEVLNVLCPVDLLIFFFLTDTGSVRSRGSAARSSLHTSVAMQFKQVVYTFSIIMAC